MIDTHDTAESDETEYSEIDSEFDSEAFVADATEAITEWLSRNGPVGNLDDEYFQSFVVSFRSLGADAGRIAIRRADAVTVGEWVAEWDVPLVDHADTVRAVSLTLYQTTAGMVPVAVTHAASDEQRLAEEWDDVEVLLSAVELGGASELRTDYAGTEGER